MATQDKSGMTFFVVWRIGTYLAMLGCVIAGYYWGNWLEYRPDLSLVEVRQAKTLFMVLAALFPLGPSLFLYDMGKAAWKRRRGKC